MERRLERMGAHGRGVGNVLSVDLEEYFQVTNFEDCVSRGAWEGFQSRVEGQVARVLDLLAEHDARATFFVLGWSAERHPRLIRRVAEAGHEIACHGYWHRLLFDESPASFRADVRRSRDLLQDIVGAPVLGYRAPSFSVTRETWWALEVLAEEGFAYDSSVFPVHHDRYGVPGAPHHPHVVGTGAGPIVELPPLTREVMGARLPAGGGGYLRLLPARWILDAIRAANALGHAATLYVHPWELDPEQPVVRGTRRRDRLRHSIGMRTVQSKLARILAEARFAPAQAVLGDLLAPVPALRLAA